MIVYRCDRCKKDIDLGVSAFDGEECLSMDIKPYNYHDLVLLSIVCFVRIV